MIGGSITIIQLFFPTYAGTDLPKIGNVKFRINGFALVAENFGMLIFIMVDGIILKDNLFIRDYLHNRKFDKMF